MACAFSIRNISGITHAAESPPHPDKAGSPCPRLPPCTSTANKMCSATGTFFTLCDQFSISIHFFFLFFVFTMLCRDDLSLTMPNPTWSLSPSFSFSAFRLQFSILVPIPIPISILDASSPALSFSKRSFPRDRLDPTVANSKTTTGPCSLRAAGARPL